MEQITLHGIFRHIVSDKNFLADIIETECDDIEDNSNKKIGYKLMPDLSREYVSLAPFERQPYDALPKIAKLFITDEYFRLGIRNITSKNMRAINISFLSSLNILLRPELFFASNASIEIQLANFNILQNFIEHKIIRNFRIDKTKNTKKAQMENKKLAEILIGGKMTHTLIDNIVNIFEINLLVLDVVKNIGYFYWTHGTNYPKLNLFKNVYCMTYIEGNYEPISTIDGNYTEIQQRDLYIKILSNPEYIHRSDEITLLDSSFVYISTWEMDTLIWSNIIEQYYPQDFKT